MGFLHRKLQTTVNEPLLSVKEFVTQYHPSLSIQAVKAAIDIGKLDAIQPERDVFIVLTDRSLTYKPRPFRGKR